MTYDYKGIKPDILLEALRVIDDNTLIAVGSDSGFVFIGLKKQFFSDLQLIETYYKGKAPNYFRIKVKPFRPFLDRQVTDMYYRKTPGEPLLLVIIIDGTESGRLWHPNEYEKAKREYTNYARRMNDDKQKDKRQQSV